MKKFDFNTIENFDDHINKSIPNYNYLIENIIGLSDYFIEKDSIVYDLGCSTGKLLRKVTKEANKIGIDIAKLIPEKDDLENNIQYLNLDLNKGFRLKNASLVYSIFTMQFLKRPARTNYIKNIYNGLNTGGALILCEKIYQKDGFFQEIMAFTHYDYKCKNFTEKEIITKERDLRYIMKPDTLEENINMLKAAGFTKITQFWQSYNFIGLIAIK